MGRSLYNTVVIKIYHMITQIVYCPVTKSGNAIFLGIRKPPQLRGFSLFYFEVITYSLVPSLQPDLSL